MSQQIAAAQFVIANISRFPADPDPTDSLNAKVLAVMDDYLTNIYQPDDLTPTTTAWLNAIGGTNADPSVFTIGAGLTLSVAIAGTTNIVGTTPASTALGTNATRGSVRRLLTALNIAFTDSH